MKRGYWIELVLVVAATALLGWFVRGPQASSRPGRAGGSGPSDTRAPRIGGRLTVWNIGLGTPRAEVEAAWGQATPHDDAWVYSRRKGTGWEGPTVYYDAQDHVRCVSGQSLEKDGQAVPDATLGVHGGAVHLDFQTDEGKLTVWRTGVPACSDPALREPINEPTSFMLLARPTPGAAEGETRPGRS